jgi:GrpB-like predicted nucleotidyltransferase (UPF0157 family)
MSVTVVEYDAAWPPTFGVAAGELAAAMGQNLAAIHHIGSTSIPDMWAKPVIDMLAVVRDLAVLDQLSPPIERLGYEAMGEFGIAGRRYFRRTSPAGPRTHQLHAFADGSPHIARHLAFRDFLRAHADVAAEYATLKRRLAQQHPEDMEAYMDGKDAFIKEVVARALAWAAHVC